MTESPPPPRSGSDPRWLWGALGGGVVGFAVAFVIYQLITPVLEASTGLVRELQGFSWSLIPVLTLLGAVLGGALVSRRR